jgi:hypothetical protein
VTFLTAEADIPTSVDKVTQEYIEQCRNDGALRDIVSALRLPPAFAACWAGRFLARPLFASAAEIGGAAADLLALFDLLAALPRRLFDGDPAAYCAALGLPAGQAEVAVRFMSGPPDRYGRADLYHDGDGFRLLEFNVASDVGGTQGAALLRALAATPPFAEFAAAHGLAYTDTGAHLARALRAAAAAVTDDPDPAVAVVCAPGGAAADRLVLAGLAETLAGHGLPAGVAEPGDLSYRGGRVLAGGRPVAVILRYFNLCDVAEAGARRWAAPLLRAYEAGRVALWTGLDSAAYSSKMTLVMLSDPRWSAALSAAERALVDRVLPLTRQLGRPDTVIDGQQVGLADYCRAHRAELLIKPLDGWSGAGVVPGWEHGDREWAARLADGARHGALIQRRVRPRPEPVADPATGRVEPWAATWGLFLTPGGYAGADIRALPASAAAVVSFAGNPRTRTTGVFTYP